MWHWVHACIPSAAARSRWRSMMLGQFWWQAAEQSCCVKCGSRSASEEMPTALRSTPHTLTHCSVSIQSRSRSTTISDARHWYTVFPPLSWLLSSRHRLDEDETAKAQTSCGSSSQITPAARFRCYPLMHIDRNRDRKRWMDCN